LTKYTILPFKIPYTQARRVYSLSYRFGLLLEKHQSRKLVIPYTIRNYELFGQQGEVGTVFAIYMVRVKKPRRYT